MTSDEDIRAAIVRYFPDDLEKSDAAEAAFINKEMLVLAAAAPDKREKALLRFGALDAYATGGRTKADLDSVLKVIGGQQSNVYRLLKRMKAVGPVSGLVKNTRAEKVASAPRSGLDSALEEWIGELLAEDPGMRIAEVTRRLVTRLDRDPIGSNLTMPKATALRRRLQMLRRERSFKTSATLERSTWLVGNDLLVDQCLLNVRLTEVPRTYPKICSAVFIVDRPTTLILGFGAYLGREPSSGMHAASERVRQVLKELAAKGVGIAARPAIMRWILTPASAALSRKIRDQAKRLNFSGNEELSLKSGVSGIELMRLVGTGIPPFVFRIRNVPDDFPREVSEAYRVAMEPEAAGATGGMVLPDLAYLESHLDVAVSIRNHKVLASMGIGESSESADAIDLASSVQVTDAILPDFLTNLFEAAIPANLGFDARLGA